MFFRGRPHEDERDATALERMSALLVDDEWPHPRVGDWIVFACGTARRVSHVWDFDDEPEESWGYQTSLEGYGYHLGDSGTQAYVSFSGSLYQSVKRNTLKLTNETRDGRVWFWHHGYQGPNCGVESTAPFRVYTCTENAPE